jgi:hypothetical protein
MSDFYQHDYEMEDANEAQYIAEQLDTIGDNLRYVTELLEVREKIRKLRDLYPTQKKDAARISFSDMTLLMAREFELMEYINSSEGK